MDAWTEGVVQFAVSVPILEEYRRVAAELERQFPMVDIGPVFDFLLVHAEITFPRALAAPLSPDAEDEKFIECALSAGIKLIVSGDKDLLGVSGYEGIQVLRPRTFVERYL